MKYSWIRIFISLLLILVLVINISPIKAHATGLVEGIAVAPLPVSVKVVAAAALICLGIMAVSESNAFDNAVDNFAKFLSETTSYVVDGMVNVFGVVGSDGLVRSYLPQGLLESGLGWAFSSGTVQSSISGHSARVGYTCYTGGVFSPCADYLHFKINYIDSSNSNIHKYFEGAIIKNTGNYYVDGKLHTASSAFVYEGNTYYIQYLMAVASWAPDAIKAGSASLGSISAMDGLDSIETACYMLLDGAFDDSLISASSDLILGLIQAPIDGVAFGDLEAYSAYAGGAISLPGIADDEEKLHLPVRIPGLEYNDDVITQTQEEAQTGVTDLEFVFTGDDVVTDDTVIDTVVGAAQSVIDHFTPSGTITDYSLDLTALFPFCIPFDVYNFLSVLRAEPVAPVFEFDLNLGVASAPICIDLSGWSDLASIVRALEVALFCIGLALKTKELIGT